MFLLRMIFAGKGYVDVMEGQVPSDVSQEGLRAFPLVSWQL